MLFDVIEKHGVSENITRIISLIYYAVICLSLCHDRISVLYLNNSTVYTLPVKIITINNHLTKMFPLIVEMFFFSIFQSIFQCLKPILLPYKVLNQIQEFKIAFRKSLFR